MTYISSAFGYMPVTQVFLNSHKRALCGKCSKNSRVKTPFSTRKYEHHTSLSPQPSDSLNNILVTTSDFKPWEQYISDYCNSWWCINIDWILSVCCNMYCNIHAAISAHCNTGVSVLFWTFQDTHLLWRGFGATTMVVDTLTTYRSSIMTFLILFYFNHNWMLVVWRPSGDVMQHWWHITYKYWHMYDDVLIQSGRQTRTL